MKRFIRIMLCLTVFVLFFTSIYADEDKQNIELAKNAKAAYLMEYTTGNVIYAKNENEKLYPASMTKMMGLLIIFENIHNGNLKWDDQVSTSAHAASMGGSQVYLEENEVLSVKDMVKSICIASANDAMVAMAEKIGGTHEKFVSIMNAKAKKLKLDKTHFVNATGLHDPNHYTCAKDMAMLGKYLIKEGGTDLLNITSMYDSYIREGSDHAFWLVNTNKLLKQYPYVDGLKTGYTTQAKSCITVSAKKDSLRFIAVVMGEPDSKMRNKEVKEMLDYGFSQYEKALLYPKGTIMKKISVENGKIKNLKLMNTENIEYVYPKGKEPREIKKEFHIQKQNAPYKKGEKVGKVKVTMSDGSIIEVPLCASKSIEALRYLDILKMTIFEMLA